MKANLTLKQRSWNSFNIAKKSINHHVCTTSRNVSSLLIYLKTLSFFFWSACYKMDPFLSTREPLGNRTKIAIVAELMLSFIRCLIGEVCSFINHVSFSQTGTTLSHV